MCFKRPLNIQNFLDPFENKIVYPIFWKKYLLNTYYVASSMLNIGTVMNKTVLTLMELTA